MDFLDINVDDDDDAEDIFCDMHIELKDGKNCNFSQKILIFQAKKCIFGSFKLCSGAKIDFLPFLK